MTLLRGARRATQVGGVAGAMALATVCAVPAVAAPSAPGSGAAVIAAPDEYTVSVDTTLLRAQRTGVLSNDTSPDGTGLTARLVEAPVHGELTLLRKGSFTYAAEEGFIGTDTFAYVARAGDERSDPVPVTITVTAFDPSICTVLGTPGDDRLRGISGTDDVICGLDGNDTLSNQDDNDVLYGGPGDDILGSEAGEAEVYGNSGNDTITDGNGRAFFLDGGPGNDTIDGGNGADFISGGSGDDEINGGNNNDHVSGGPGADEVETGNGFDFVDVRDGVAGNDRAEAGLNDDVCRADAADRLSSCEIKP